MLYVPSETEFKRWLASLRMLVLEHQAPRRTAAQCSARHRRAASHRATGPQTLCALEELSRADRPDCAAAAAAAAFARRCTAARPMHRTTRLVRPMQRFRPPQELQREIDLAAAKRGAAGPAALLSGGDRVGAASGAAEASEGGGRAPPVEWSEWPSGSGAGARLG